MTSRNFVGFASGLRCLLTQRPGLLAALLAVAAAVSAILACGWDVADPTPTPPPDAESILASSGKAMARLETFRFELAHRGGGTSLAGGLVVKEVVGDVVKPDSLKLSWEGPFAGFFVRAEVIALEGDTYMTDPITGRWGTIAGDVNPLGFFDPAVGIAFIMSDLTDATVAGREALGDLQAYRIEGLLPSLSLAPLLGTVAPDLMVETEAWIGVDGSYLHQVVFRGRVTPEDPDDIKRTVTLSSFNQPVTIEAPVLE